MPMNVRRRASDTLGVRCQLPVCSAGIPTGIHSQQFRSSCWISTLRLAILPELRLNLLEILTDSGKNLLKVSAFSGAGILEILKMRTLSGEPRCFDAKCH